LAYPARCRRQFLPVENIVYANQHAYYEAINTSTEQSNSVPFIDFTLGEILTALEKHKEEPRPTAAIGFTEKVTEKLTEKASAILHLVGRNLFISTTEMARQLGVSREAIAKTILLLENQNLLRRIGPDKGGHWGLTAPK
jgi:predicted HTH transcriptional regulator